MTKEIEKKYLLSEDGQIYAKRHENVFPIMCLGGDLENIISNRTRHNALVGLVEAFSTLGGNGIQSVLPYWPHLRNAGRDAMVLTQGYLPIETGKNLATQLGLQIGGDIVEARIRRKHSLKDGSDQYVFTAKGDGTLSRSEYETEVSSEVYNEFASQFTGAIEKIRMKYGLEPFPVCDGKPFSRFDKWKEGTSWFNPIAEVDFYLNRNLVTAEVECPSIEIANKISPLGKDITEDKGYKNKNLALPL